MDITTRTHELNAAFSYEKQTRLDNTHLHMVPFRFTQIRAASEIDGFQRALSTTDFCSVTDDHIQENKDFTYVIFTPSGKAKRSQAIILLHGLNERTWEKYLTWAEYLCEQTDKPVILFPIAFHMNRTPSQWSNPRTTLSWVNQRKKEMDDPSNATFANVTLRDRKSVV